MTPEHIHTVQSTWVKVLPVKGVAAELFGERLFEIDPTVRGLFRGDMRQQGVTVVRVIDATVKGLSRLERTVPLIRELGRRYAGYGIKDRHYRTVGAALHWTLDKCLGDEFTPQVKEAWATVYGVLALTMREAAVPARIRNALPGPQRNRMEAA